MHDGPRTDDLVRELKRRGYVVTLAGEVPSVVAAEILGIKEGTLRRWRSTGKGPPWRKRGRVWYRVADLQAFLDSSTVKM